MASIADVYVTVLPETGKIAAGIKKALRDVDDDARDAAKRSKKEIETQLRGIKVNIEGQLQVDTGKAKKEIEAATKGQVVPVETKVDKPSAAKTEAALDVVARDREAKIKVKVDSNSLKKAATQLQETAGFGKGGVAFPGTRVKIPPLVGIEALGAAPSVVPVIGSMVQAVGQLSGALGVLPAAMGAAGLAIGSLKIATAGFGDAMKNIGDVEKFNESVAQLAPSMQTAARGVQSLLPQITQLKMTVGQAFGEGFSDQVQKLGSTTLPLFQDIMSRMSQSAGHTLGDIFKQLQTPEMQSDIKTFGTNASQAFSNLLQAASPLLKAFTDIATVGSSFLPELANSVAGLAEKFSDFIGEARESGKLAESIQGGIDAFIQLKDIAVNVWDIFKGIFQAAGGGDFLDTVVELTNTWSTWVNSIEGQNSLRDFFDEAKDTIADLWPIIRDMGIALYNAFMGAKQVLDEILPMLQTISNFLATHKTLVEGIGIAFGAWKLASIVKDIDAIGLALLGLGGKGATAGTAAGAGLRAGILSGFGGSLTIPIVLAASVATVGKGVGDWVSHGGDPTLSRFGPRPGHSGEADNWLDQSVTEQTTQDIAERKAGTPNAPPLNPDLAALFPNPADNVPGPQAPSPHGGLVPAVPRVPGPSPNAVPDVSQQPAPDTNFYNPPAPSSSGSGSGTGTGAPGAPGAGQDVAPSGFNWAAVVPYEGGTWDNADTGRNGHYGGLQFSPETWAAFGGLKFASRPDYASPEDQMTVADRTAFYGWTDPDTGVHTDPQGLGAWEAITKGSVPGISTSTQPPRPTPQYGSGIPGYGSSSGNRGRGGYGSGAPMPRQSYGLPAGSNSGGYGGTGVNFPEWVNQNATTFGLKPSTYPGHQAGSGLNKGIDWSGTPAQMRQLAEWAMAHPDQFEQLIYSDPETGKKYGLAGGKPVGPGTDQPGYYADDWVDHEGHVHTRQSESWGPQYEGEGGYGPGDMYSYDGPGTGADNPMYVESATGGEQLGKDIVSGIGEIFGLGTLFKDPTQFGLFKIFKSIMGLGSGMGGGENGEQSGGGLFGGLLGGGSGNGTNVLTNMLTAFGPLNGGSPGDAPGEFIPGTGVGAGGGLNLGNLIPGGVGGAAGAQPNAPVDQRVMNNNFGYGKEAVADAMRERDLRIARPGLQNTPSR